MKKYRVIQAVADKNGKEHFEESIVECSDPTREIWLNEDKYPNVLSVSELTFRELSTIG